MSRFGMDSKAADTFKGDKSIICPISSHILITRRRNPRLIKTMGCSCRPSTPSKMPEQLFPSL